MVDFITGEKSLNSDSVTGFYAALTPFYHLIYPDWEKGMERQALMLDEIIRENWDNALMVLDAACGIGTQSIGLAKLGYTLTSSDLSPEEIERAKLEADKRGLTIAFSVSDMRSVYDHHNAQFDLVIACDNSVPHLLTDKDILKAFKQFYKCTRTGGGVLISVRDYVTEDFSEQQVKLYGTRQENSRTYLIFQRWEWHGEIYDLSMYFVEDDGSTDCKTNVMRSQYYAVSTDKLISLLTKAGFCEVGRLDGKFYQPVIIGRKK